ncbi:MAG: hypothetical protein ACT4ON_13820 [Bacteroidota bacterium]
MVLNNFAFKYTDNDQTIMWLGLKNYSSGLFYEPRFYGQAYNSMLEAFLAVPLYKFGIPVYKSLPIITSVLTLIPYFIISLLVFLKKSAKISFLIISIPLLLPIEYSFITSLPRGFVTGIFVSVLGCIGLFYSKSKASFLFSSFFAVLGYTINSNSILISIPCLIYLFLENSKNKHYYLFSLIGLAVGFTIHFSVDYFYVLNPHYNLHRFQTSFSIQNLILSLNTLDIHFNDVTPIFWKSGFLVLFMFLIISILLLNEKAYKKAVVVALIPFIVISTLGINKVHDGTHSVFYSYSRMYLSIPMLLGISLSFLNNITYPKFLYLYLLIPAVYFVYNINNLNTSIESSTKLTPGLAVGVIETSKLTDECNYLKTICDSCKIQLIIISNHWNSAFYAYGCPSCIGEFPNTLNPNYERRTWRLIEDENKIYRRILIIDIEKKLASEFNFIKKIGDKEGFFIIENNSVGTKHLLDSLGINYRKY